jgi:hypothetical protein
MPEQNDDNASGNSHQEETFSPLIKAYIDQEIQKAHEADERSRKKKWKNSWRSASPITKGTFIIASAVALATVGYCIIAGLQLTEMKHTNELTQKALDGSDKTLQATLAKLQGQIDATNALSGHAKDQADQASMANQAYLQTDRPWVGIVFNVADWVPDKTPVATVYFVNSGRRPAQIIETELDSGDFESLPNPPIYTALPNDVRGSGLILPNSNANNTKTFEKLTTSRLEQLGSRKKAFFIYASIDYKDVKTGQKHWTHGCIRYLPGFTNAMNGFVNCTEYNQSDEEAKKP